MKSKKIISVGVVLGLSLLIGASNSSAAQVVGQGKTSGTKITISDNVNPLDPGVDPLNPTDPNQKNLVLEKVPASYDFQAKLQNGTYNLTTNLIAGQTISVFNDRISRDWSVKATLKDGRLTKETDVSKQFAVNEFKINDTLVYGTGATGIVAKSAAVKTAENNTGLIDTAVTNVSISFVDSSMNLRVGDSLKGEINYTLYNTVNAQ